MKQELGSFGRLMLAVGIAFHAGLYPARSADAVRSVGGRGKSDRSDKFFADPQVSVFRIVLSQATMDSLRRSARTYVTGIVHVGTQVLTNVGVHLKGMGSFQPLDLKPSFALKFDEFAPGQEFLDLTKLMLNNSVQDRTYLSEFLATRLFRDAGVPAARVTHARVTLNGRDLGLYVAIEAMNKRFLKRHFADNSGDLYEGYLRDIDTRLDQDNGTNTTQADVRALLGACGIANPSERFVRLEALLDVERFASFAAMEVLTAHWDGYTLHTNNYRLYHDPSSDKMSFITHGLDGVFRRPNISIQPPMKGVVSRALFQTAQGRRLYDQRLRTLYTNVYQLSVITNRLAEALMKLRGANLPGAHLAEIERQTDILRERIARRVTRVGEQLAGIEPIPLKFEPSGLARPGDWRDEYDHGEPVLDQVTIDGRKALHIQARGGRCRASWRTMIYLKPGQYQFEGRIRTKGITRGGAGLRISGDTRNMRMGGDSSWGDLRHVFEVKEETGDVELVCEFDAPEGEVWYDLDSLRVRSH